MMQGTHRIAGITGNVCSRLYLFIQHDEFKSCEFWGALFAELFIESNCSDPKLLVGMVWIGPLQWNAGHPTYKIFK
jgi:hypothetical protein